MSKPVDTDMTGAAHAAHITDIEAAMQDAARLNARVAELEDHVRALLPLAMAAFTVPGLLAADKEKIVDAAFAALQGVRS